MPEKPARNQNVELLRIMSAYGIVLFHSGAPGGQVGYGGLVVFLALAMFFAGDRKPGLWKRIFVPWAFWMLVYAILGFVTKGRALPDTNIVAAILTGSSVHLWYLPFIFAITWLVWLLRPSALAGAVLALVLLVTAPWRVDWPVAPPVSQWLQALPAIGIGLALPSTTARWIAATGVLIAAFWMVPGIGLPYLVGGGALAAALLLPPLPWNVEPLSRCMYGVYLVHMIALPVFNRVTGQGQIATAVLAFLCSCLAVYAARRFVPRTRLVLG